MIFFSFKNGTGKEKKRAEVIGHYARFGICFPLPFPPRLFRRPEEEEERERERKEKRGGKEKRERKGRRKEGEGGEKKERGKESPPQAEKLAKKCLKSTFRELSIAKSSSARRDLPVGTFSEESIPGRGNNAEGNFRGNFPRLSFPLFFLCFPLLFLCFSSAFPLFFLCFSSAGETSTKPSRGKTEEKQRKNLGCKNDSRSCDYYD